MSFWYLNLALLLFFKELSISNKKNLKQNRQVLKAYKLKKILKRLNVFSLLTIKIFKYINFYFSNTYMLDLQKKWSYYIYINNYINAIKYPFV